MDVGLILAALGILIGVPGALVSALYLKDRWKRQPPLDPPEKNAA